jgi:hypothetical protein
VTDGQAREQLVAGLCASFPRVEAGPETRRAYVAALQDVPLPLLRDSIRDLIRSSRYLPTIRDIRERVAERGFDLPGPFEAWEQIVARPPRPLPEPVRRALNMVGGSWEVRNTTTPGLLRRDFIAAYQEIRAALINEVVLGMGAPQLPEEGQ